MLPSDTTLDPAPPQTLSDTLLELWTTQTSIAQVTRTLGLELQRKRVPVLRVSLGLIPSAEEDSSLHYLWRASGPSEVETLRRHFGFFQEREHLESPLAALLSDRRPMVVDLEDPAVRSAYPPFQELHGEGGSSWLGLSIPTRTLNSAFLTVALGRGHTFPNPLVEELERLSAPLGLLLQALESERALELSSTDPLTGLLNRTGYLREARRFEALCRRNRMPVCLASLDLDYFKLLNDRFGHTTGDRALLAVGREITRIFRRDTDLCGRIGGEEFVVAMPATRLDRALELCQRLIASVQELALPNPASPISDRLTLSIGLTENEDWDHMDWVMLQETADQALAEAKRAGRNRIVAREIRPGNKGPAT